MFPARCGRARCLRHRLLLSSRGWRSGGYGLRWATGGEARSDNADAVGAMLIAENLASIHHRYPDTLDGGTIPGPCEAYWNEPYVFRCVRPAPTPVEGLKLIDCY